jgi:hypothetical protein
MHQHRKIRIFAPPGGFPSVEAAAVAEEQIDWGAPIGPRHEACVLSFAAVEIRDALRMVPESEAEVARPADGADPPGIYLATRRGLDAGEYGDVGDFNIPELPTHEQSYAIGTRRRDEDAPADYLIVGADPTGALYGAYELLNRLDFRWWSPDPWDVHVPAALDLPDLSVTEAPSFALRGFWATDDRGTREFLLWMARNKLNLWSAEQPEKAFCRKLGIRLTTGGHTIFERYAPPATYFSEHPDWYGMRNGARSPDIRGVLGDNMCMSNPDARRHIAEAMADDLATGEWRWVDLINVWALDNGKYCECEACKAAGNPTDHIMLLAHDCREAVKRARADGRINREVYVAVPAYHETLDPPSKPLPDGFDHDGIVVTFFPIERCFVHPFADPSCMELNQPLLEYWKAWTENPENPFHGAMLVGEYYNVSSYASMATPFVRSMSADIPYYYATGARMMHYMHVGMADWGTLSLTNSQYAAMLWQHDLDVDEFVQDYLVNRYGRQWDTMARFYRILESAMENAKPLKHYAGMSRHTLRNTLRKGDATDEAALFTTRHLRYDGRSVGTDSGPSLAEIMQLLSEAEALIDHALIRATEPSVRDRIRADLRRFRYTHETVRFYYHGARMRLFEGMEDGESAGVEARALRDSGEALRRETLMPRLDPRGDLEDWQRYYTNGLTATWIAGFYLEAMERYGLDTPDTPNGKRERQQGDEEAI